MRVKKQVTRVTAVLLSAAMLFSSVMGNAFAITASAAIPETTIATASERAYKWLKTMQDSTYQQKLVDSFEDYDSQGNPYVVSYTYDQACAAIAFMLKGDMERATRILDMLALLQTPQDNPIVKNRGAWCNSYYNNQAAYLYGEEIRLHVGVAMWVCMAVMEYENVTGDTTRYHTMATNAIDWALQFQQPNGGVAGGRTTWDSGNGSWTDEVWSSTEHNEDIYGVLCYFAKNTPQKAATYTAAATKAKSFLDNVVWDESRQRFYGGFKNNTGLVDPFVPMDVAPWGVLALGTSGVHNYSNMLAYVENANGTPGTLSNPRYKQTLVYNGVNTLTSYDFDWQDDGAPGSSSSGGGVLGADIWFEGSAFMSAAYYLAGNEDKANEILVELAKKQSTGVDSHIGGIPYSLNGTNNNYWRMSNANSVSSTAWYIIAAERFNPFHAEYMDENGGNTGGGTGDDGGNEETGFGVKQNGTSTTIWYAPTTSCSWADAHYTINNGAQSNVKMTYNTTTKRWEKTFEMAENATLKYFVTFDSNGLAYDSEWFTYTGGSNQGGGNTGGGTSDDGGNTGGTSNPTSQEYGVSVSGKNATIWFVPTTTAGWVDVHYTLNGQPQQNFRMTYNNKEKCWEKTIDVPNNFELKYYYTYEKDNLACDTAWETFNK